MTSSVLHKNFKVWGICTLALGAGVASSPLHGEHFYSRLATILVKPEPKSDGAAQPNWQTDAQAANQDKKFVPRFLTASEQLIPSIRTRSLF
jgi:hypothetical protein